VPQRMSSNSSGMAQPVAKAVRGMSVVLLGTARPPNVDNPGGGAAALLCGRKKREIRPAMVPCPDAARDACTSLSTAAVCCNSTSVLRSWSRGATRTTDIRAGTPLATRIGTAEGRSACAGSAADAPEVGAAAVGTSVVESGGPGAGVLIATEALDDGVGGASGAGAAPVAGTTGGGGSVEAFGALGGAPTVDGMGGGAGHVELATVVYGSTCVTAVNWGSACMALAAGMPDVAGPAVAETGADGPVVVTRTAPERTGGGGSAPVGAADAVAGVGAACGAPDVAWGGATPLAA